MATAIQTRPIDARKGIETVQDLKDHLYHAAQVELSTIPLYLYAAYSIQTVNYSQWSPGMSAFRTIRSVVIEEMLHLCLARNLMVAIGGSGEITFYDPDFVFEFPNPMLHRVPDLMLQLEPLTPALAQTIFMPLEKPAASDAPPQPDRYNTLGQFYAAIQDGFDRLDKTLWSNPDTDLQYASTYWNQDGGGSPIVVSDLTTATQAIKTIVEQGEGARPGDENVPLDPARPQLGLTELSHYAKFKRIAEGIDGIGNVWPVMTNPKVSDYGDTPAGRLAGLFNAAYCYVLCMIDGIYHLPRNLQPGERSPRYGLERSFIAAMGGVLFPVADLLVRQELPDATHAAPTFEFHAFGGDDRKAELSAMCDALLGDFPSLGGEDSVRQLIGRLPAV
ncbi:MAG: ferritin-like domain-containing protein [Actinomycetota bacterium]